MRYILLLCAALNAIRLPLVESAWSLTTGQRRRFIEYYAPLLFKRARESSSRRGYDWVTNFDFDNDKRFSNNKENWEDLNSFIDGSDHAEWNIRPTMYTAMLEHMSSSGDRKDATLLYHVYHAKQDKSIHDWERIEIRLFGITGDPGSGEEVSHVVVTEHSKHNVRRFPDSDLNFMTTRYGRHPMIWQAEQADSTITGLVVDFFGSSRFYRGELHFVEDSWEKVRDDVEDDDEAEVDVNGGGKKNFQYIFVPRDDRDAVAFWRPQTLRQSAAGDLYHGKGNDRVRYREVKRIYYELQDIADILPTHWTGGFYQRHWTSARSARILLETRLRGGLDGGPSVPAGMQSFYSRSIDDEDTGEHRSGYPTKHWFWGAYILGDDGIYSEALRDEDRAAANGDLESIEERYWHQHDYFVHGGPERDERWLPRGWHLEANGGFDGRWEQLF